MLDRNTHLRHICVDLCFSTQSEPWSEAQQGRRWSVGHRHSRVKLVTALKSSPDSMLADKIEDRMNRCLSPAKHVLMLCWSGKIQVQATGRAPPGLLLKKRRAASPAHDYKPYNPQRST